MIFNDCIIYHLEAIYEGNEKSHVMSIIIKRE